MTETTVTLLPTSKKLKQLIKQHGDQWIPLGEPKPLQCFNNEMGLLIASQDKKHFRNVLVSDVIMT